jgi:hypothetical protein
MSNSAVFPRQRALSLFILRIPSPRLYHRFRAPSTIVIRTNTGPAKSSRMRSTQGLADCGCSDERIIDAAPFSTPRPGIRKQQRDAQHDVACITAVALSWQASALSRGRDDPQFCAHSKSDRKSWPQRAGLVSIGFISPSFPVPALAASRLLVRRPAEPGPRTGGCSEVSRI